MPLKTTVGRQTKQAKFSRLSGSMAVSMAKKRNDPMYRKMKKAKDKYMQYKKNLRQKYAIKGKQAARKKISK